MHVVMASANAHKVAEMVDLMAVVAPQVTILERPTNVPPVSEDAETLFGNARLKAQALVNATGVAALSDDTGLFVDALGGLPGVHTARYAGVDASDEANIEKLLLALEAPNFPAQGRRAVFRTVALLLLPDGNELVGEGQVFGSIATCASGARGFGYDPVFVPDGSSLTFSEMSLTEKHSHSHRGQAFRALGRSISIHIHERPPAHE